MLAKGKKTITFPHVAAVFSLVRAVQRTHCYNHRSISVKLKLIRPVGNLSNSCCTQEREPGTHKLEIHLCPLPTLSLGNRLSSPACNKRKIV